MTALESRLLRQLKKLPPDRIAEVVDFVEFLAAREERQVAAQRVGESMASLHALDLPPMSEEEIEDAVQDARRGRRQAGEKAGGEGPRDPDSDVE